MTDMPTGLIRRGAAYSLRRRVPKDLLPAFGGRNEIVKALGTNDREEAKRLHARAWVELDVEFGKLRDQRNLRGSEAKEVGTPAYGQWQDISQRDFEVALDHMDEQARLNDQADYEAEQRQSERDAVRALLDTPIAMLTDGQIAVREVLEGYRDDLETARHLRPTPPPIQAPVADTTRGLPQSAGGMSFSRLVDLWARERRVDAKTEKAMRAVISWFQARAGTLSPAEVTTAHVRQFKQALLDEGVAPANIQTKLSRLKSLMNFAQADGYTVGNPVKDVTIVVRAQDRKSRRPYAKAELNALFSGPVHALGDRPARGRGEAAYWLPVMALYTGARLEELAQLIPDDVREEDYDDLEGNPQRGWFIHVSATPDGAKRLKNAGSARIIPVHQALLDLGLVAFALAAKSKNQNLLFPGLTRNGYGRLGAKWGEWFSDYRRNTCGITDRGLNFHAFRHTFARNARDRSVDDGVLRRLMGHSARDVSDHYGKGYSLHRLVLEMAKYQVPGLDPISKPASLAQRQS